jgi:hypothetical protein
MSRRGFLHHIVDLSTYTLWSNRQSVEIYNHSAELEDYLVQHVQKKLFWNEYIGTFQDCETRKLYCVMEHGMMGEQEMHKYRMAQNLVYIAMDHQVPLECFHLENFFSNVHGHLKFASVHVRKREEKFHSYREALQHCFQKLGVEPEFFENKCRLLDCETHEKDVSIVQLFEQTRLQKSIVLSPTIRSNEFSGNSILKTSSSSLLATIPEEDEFY